MDQRPVMRLVSAADAQHRPKIDIDQLTEEELTDLNRRIVERLRMIRDLRAHQNMLRLRIGQRVRFRDGAGRSLHGTLTKYNRKTVTVITHNGEQWNVSPALVEAEK